MLRFKTTILKPWDDLCELLIRQVVFQTEMGSPIAKAGDLAVAIKHLPEIYPQFRGDFKAESVDFKLIDDVADGWKHGSNSLKNRDRRHNINVQSVFEVSEDDRKFKFIRSTLLVDHATHGVFDFLEVSSSAIKYWIAKAGVHSDWVGEVKVANSEYEPKAVLYHESSLQLELENATLHVVKNINGVMVPYDPPLIHYEVRASNGS